MVTQESGDEALGWSIWIASRQESPDQFKVPRKTVLEE